MAFETLRTNPDDAPALNRWRRGVIVGDCLALAVALYGFAIHFMGGTSRQVAPFFIVGNGGDAVLVAQRTLNLILISMSC
jgi:hypothetical protein